MKLAQNPIKLLRHKIGNSILVLVIAMQIVNLSIDAVDPSPYYEDLTVNEIESCLEFVVEIVMGHEDAIEETDDSDHQTQKPGTTVTLFSTQSIALTPENTYQWILAHNRYFQNDRFLSINKTIVLPPPKVNFVI